VTRAVRWGLLVAIPAAAGLVVGARLVPPSHARVPQDSHATHGLDVELHVPRAGGPIVIDGELGDDGWLGRAARTGGFVASDGSQSRPYSDARMVWSDGTLYVALYAADEDLRATYREGDAPLWLEDAFHLSFRRDDTELTFDVSPLGTLTDAQRTGERAFDYSWQSGARVSRDVDGTLNDPADDDEEWVIEMAIPLQALGLRGTQGERTGFSIHRCDTPKRGPRLCGGWGEGARGGVLVLD
jgi:hypothetical protein